jgi:membrane-associated protease RseP (regulator of RpoE activity)
LKPLAVRFLIVFAGPAMNFVLAVVIFSLVFMILGRPVAPTLIGRVVEGGPVAQAGLKTGDRITAIDGRPVQYWEDVQRAVQDSHGGMLGLTVQGAAGERKVGVTPVQTKTRDLFGDERQTWDLGARPYVPPSIGELVAGFPPRKRDSSGATSSVRSRGSPCCPGTSWPRDPAAARPADPPRGEAGRRDARRSPSYPTRSRSAVPTARRSRSGASGSARLRASASSARTRFRRSERESTARSR